MHLQHETLTVLTLQVTYLGDRRYESDALNKLTPGLIHFSEVGGDVGVFSGHILKSVSLTKLFGRDLWAVDLNVTDVFLKTRMRSCQTIRRPQRCPQRFLLPDLTRVHIEPADFNQLPAQTDDCCGSCSALLSPPHDVHCMESLGTHSESWTPGIQVLKSLFGSSPLALISVTHFSTQINKGDPNKSPPRILLKTICKGLNSKPQGSVICT